MIGIRAFSLFTLAARKRDSLGIEYGDDIAEMRGTPPCRDMSDRGFLEGGGEEGGGGLVEAGGGAGVDHAFGTLIPGPSPKLRSLTLTSPSGRGVWRREFKLLAVFAPSPSGRGLG